MKIIVLLFLSIIGLNPILCQIKVQPIVALNYTPNFYFTKMSGNFSGGVVLHERIYLEAHLGYCKFENSKPLKDIGIDFLSNSYSIGYRLFERYKLSPIFKFEYGFQIYSNDKGEIIDQFARIINQDNYQSMGYFNKIKSFGTISLLLGYKIRFMELYTGCGYRINNISYSSMGYTPVNVIWKIRYWELYFGVRFNLNKEQ